MLPKLIVLVGLVVLVWKAFKFGALYQQRHAARAGGGPATRTPPRDARPETRAQDLHRCPSCDAYVAAGSAPCGRGDCPQRR